VGIEFPQVLPDTEEALLHGIASILLVQEYLERQGKCVPLMHFHKPPEGTTVAPLRSGDELFRRLHGDFLLTIVQMLQS
jgi:hypothetical protein